MPVNKKLTCVVLMGCCVLGCARSQDRSQQQGCFARGIVTLDGTPVRSGTVTFVPVIPETDGIRPGLATIGPDGYYTLTPECFGRRYPVRPGDYRVTVLSMAIRGVGDRPSPHSVTPGKYADVRLTPLRATLSDDPQNIDFHLIR